MYSGHIHHHIITRVYYVFIMFKEIQGGPKKTIPKLTKIIHTLMIFLAYIQ